MYINRTVCEALEEMRKLYKTYNFAPILGLIEEVQSMVNRMEGALGDKHDIRRLQRERKELNKEVNELEKKVKGLKKDKETFTFKEVVGREQNKEKE